MWRLALPCAAALALALPATSVSADELTLANGRVYKGLVVEKGADYVVFRVYTASGGKMVVRYNMNEVDSLDVDGKEPVFAPVKTPTPAPTPPPKPIPKPTPKPGPVAPVKTQTQPAAGSGDARTVKRNPSEIDALIESVGKAPPDWWESVELKYPDTLDLAGTAPPSKEWAPQKNIGAYLWSVVNPNPPRWREGIRTLHHVLTVRADNKPRLAETMNQLADCYHHYEQDWARSAYWRRKAMTLNNQVFANAIVSLAECYWMLGSQAMAESQMRQYSMDKSGFPPAIKLYADMGQRDLALRLAQDLARSNPVVGLVSAGEVCRTMGRYKDAVTCFEKALADPQAAKNDRYRNRAAANLEAVKLYEGLDIKEVPDGKFRANSVGFRGPVEVEVEVKGGKILSVKVLTHKEDEYFYHMAIRQMPKRIVDKQTVKAIDAVTGATVTSDAIVNATAKALSAAAKPAAQ